MVYGLGNSRGCIGHDIVGQACGCGWVGGSQGVGGGGVGWLTKLTVQEYHLDEAKGRTRASSAQEKASLLALLPGSSTYQAL
jgi:hypothetical protein